MDMEDVIIQIIVTCFLVLTPLIGSRTKRSEPDFKAQTEIHSIYGVNADGKLELLNRENEERA
ncbi:hypothetical protein [Mucilaginibacter psychrotolerans]|uniref:Uncharacterized protein n=1 Tax=Mucilaginibacter psychrotolerans TaxID=1524096 RepID=A0A4Y8SKE0_9SPHI|nr:hypothetical protein [Mucilaginibacter psychrotolerans]TFF39155.1 hypothetical protein E2R66_05910 [Mucilaginibacter psychrotolerans]